ncbi:MAG: hypothetical protein J1E33_04810 [Alistipes sp.]|nr:hypothetical protein [Alistipes sp.]
MKKLRYYPAVVLAALMAATGCNSVSQTSATYGDGMYVVHDKVRIAEKQRLDAELRRAEAEARRAELEARIAEQEVALLENGYYNDYSYSSVLADNYESAYARRLLGFSSPTYRMPSSYYDLRYSGVMNYVTAYDPAFYNIMVSGNQVWVEPKYISSMFGSWGATRVTFGLSFNYGWYYGWNRPYYYSSWWGYPHYSWYDWNWGMCYHNPWWGYGYGWNWNHGWGPGHYRPPYAYAPSPSHRPSYGGPSSSGRPPRQDIVNRPMYTSPSSGKSYGSRTSQGTVSGSGVYRPGSSSGSPASSGTSRPSTAPNVNRGSSSSGSGSSVNTRRSGSSSFFGGSSSSSGSRSGSSSSSSGNRSGGSGISSGSRGSSGGSTGRGNSIGR